MVKQREGFAVIITKEAQERIDNNQCPGCCLPKHKWKRRTDWRCCSTKCTDKYNIEMVTFGWGDLRAKVFKRDNWTCIKCGKRPNRKLWIGFPKDISDYINTYMKNFPDVKILDLIEEKGYYSLIVHKTDSSNLIGDHIIPIALGGDEWDIDNVQTLCIDCDKVKTRKDQADIGKLRRKEKLEAKGQTTL